MKHVKRFSAILLTALALVFSNALPAFACNADNPHMNCVEASPEYQDSHKLDDSPILDQHNDLEWTSPYIDFDHQNYLREELAHAALLGVAISVPLIVGAVIVRKIKERKKYKETLNLILHQEGLD